MVCNLGHQKCPVAVRSRDFDRKGADTNIAMHCVSITVTCYLKWPHRERSHRHLDWSSAHFYYEEEQGRRSAAKLLTKDEARRMAVNSAKLPVLLKQSKLLGRA